MATASSVYLRVLHVSISDHCCSLSLPLGRLVSSAFSQSLFVNQLSWFSGSAWGPLGLEPLLAGHVSSVNQVSVFEASWPQHFKGSALSMVYMPSGAVRHLPRHRSALVSLEKSHSSWRSTAIFLASSRPQLHLFNGSVGRAPGRTLGRRLFCTSSSTRLSDRSSLTQSL